MISSSVLETQQKIETISSNIDSLSSSLSSVESGQSSTDTKLAEMSAEQTALKSLVEERLGDISKDLEAAKAQVAKAQSEVAETKKELQEAREKLAYQAERQEILEKARAEGQLILYTSQRGPRDALIEEFEKMYPSIDVEFYRTTSPNLNEKIRGEATAEMQTFDVVETSDIFVKYMKEKGWLLQYESPEVEVFREDMYDPEHYWYVSRVVVMAFYYNTDLVTEDMLTEGWNALTKPIFKDRLVLGGGDLHQFTTKTLMAAYEHGVITQDWIKTVYKDQNTMIVTGYSDGKPDVQRGEKWVSVLQPKHAVIDSEAGFPVTYKTLEPTFGESKRIAIYSKAPHSNAAKLYVDFILSQRGQEIEAEYGEIAVRPGVKTLVDIDNVILLEIPEEKEMAEFIELYRSIIE
jgi:iron(III) transport system substrate-binding protein